MDLIGSLGHILLAVCGVPAAIETLRKKYTPVPWSLLIPWGLGEVLALMHAIYYSFTPTYVNYITNIVAIGIMVYYKLKGKSDNGE